MFSLPITSSHFYYLCFENYKCLSLRAREIIVDAITSALYHVILVEKRPPINTKINFNVTQYNSKCHNLSIFLNKILAGNRGHRRCPYGRRLMMNFGTRYWVQSLFPAAPDLGSLSTARNSRSLEIVFLVKAYISQIFFSKYKTFLFIIFQCLYTCKESSIIGANPRPTPTSHIICHNCHTRL